MSLRRVFIGLSLVVTAALGGCGGNTGFELEITPLSTWNVPADFSSIQVQITPQTANGQSEPYGKAYPVTASDARPYVIVILANSTQYTQAVAISVTLLKSDGTVFQQLTEGDIPFQQGQLKPVAFNMWQ